MTRRARDRRRKLPRFTDRVAVGPLRVSPFCLGMTRDWRMIPAAFERGINFFFVSADMHWPLYEPSRKGLRDLLSRRAVRDDVVVAGVCYPTQPEFQLAPLRELVTAVRGLERIDLAVAGGVYGPDLIARTQIMRNAGIARAVAASFHDRQAALAAANHRLVELCYIRYNPTHPGARRELLPHLVAGHAPLFNFKSMLGYKPAAELAALAAARGIATGELWLPDATDHYRYALSRPELAGVLFSVDRPAQLAALADALPRGGLTPDEESHLDELAILAAST